MEFVDPEYRNKILQELKSIETGQDVKILFAIESGSRAWGFPSPDSDYDARFVYVRRPDWYISITPGRDVIELPIDDLLDINGWDIRKALGLLLKPNAVLLEWLGSPIQYIWNDALCQPLTRFSQEISHTKACLYHYRNLGMRQYHLHLEDKVDIKLKKLLYVLRPAMAVRWLRYHPDRFPPMDFKTSMDGCEVDTAIREQIDEILTLKAKTKEIGLSRARPDINAFCLSEFDWAEAHAKDFTSPAKDKLPAANTLFRRLVQDAWT